MHGRSFFKQFANNLYMQPTKLMGKGEARGSQGLIETNTWMLLFPTLPLIFPFSFIRGEFCKITMAFLSFSTLRKDGNQLTYLCIFHESQSSRYLSHINESEGTTLENPQWALILKICTAKMNILPFHGLPQIILQWELVPHLD